MCHGRPTAVRLVQVGVLLSQVGMGGRCFPFLSRHLLARKGISSAWSVQVLPWCHLEAVYLNDTVIVWS